MSPKQWLALFCFYISYLFFGASVFYHIEHELEATQRAYDLQHRIDIKGNNRAETIYFFAFSLTNDKSQLFNDDD